MIIKRWPFPRPAPAHRRSRSPVGVLARGWTDTGASSASDHVVLQGGPVKGAPSGRVAEAMAQAPTVTVPPLQAVSGSYRMRHPHASASSQETDDGTDPLHLHTHQS